MFKKVIVIICACVGIISFALGFSTYDEGDLSAVRSIIMEQTEPTIVDYLYYDVNHDLKISATDYIHIKNNMNKSNGLQAYVAIGCVYVVCGCVVAYTVKCSKEEI